MCRKTREEFINQECEEAEKLEKINNAKFHSKVKSLTWPRKKVAHSLIDDNGTEIYDANDILNRWKQYFEHLYDDNRENASQITIPESAIPTFSTEEIKSVISKLNNKKS